MKNLKFLFFPIVILLITSCGKDFSDELTGSWTLASVSISDCPDIGISAVTFQATNGCVSVFGDEECLTITMNDDNTGTLTFGGEANAFTYTADNDTERGSICGDGECQDITLEDGRLVLTVEEEGCPFSYNFDKS